MPSSRNASSKGGFPTLGLSDTLLAAVTALGYEEPTPVQRATIPVMLAGRDLLAQAATGTGKTAAFALPMIQRMTEPAPEPDASHDERADRARRAAGIHEERPRLVGRKLPRSVPVGGLVLVPTRELAMQVSEAIHKYAGGTGIIVVPLYGGAAMEQQIRALDRGAQIVVATPGRALDHIRRTTLRLDGIRLLVLDEADEMLDMGFAEDIEQIIAGTPATRQTALFSATLPARILKIAQRHLRTPERVTIAAEKSASGTLPRVRQVAYIVRRDQKPAALDRILDMEHPRTAIVFCRTRLAVDTLVETQGLAADVIQRAAWRGDDDVRAAIECANLLLHRCTAVERDDDDAGPVCVLVDRLTDLHRQLACRDEYETTGRGRLRLLPAAYESRSLFVNAGSPSRAFGTLVVRRAHLWRRLSEALDHGEGEGGGLAGSSGGLSEQIAAAEHDGDRLPLDRRRFLVAERGHSRQQGLGKPECREAPLR